MIGFMLLSTGALQAQDKPELEIGGAVRFNYNLSLKEAKLDDDVFQKMQSQVQRLNAEYRLYSEGFEAECTRFMAYDFV
jgi:hypothetical protein